MPDYQNGKIYELVCRVTGKRYIGSTCDTLSKRLYGHKRDVNREKKCKSSEVIIGGDYYINLLRACAVNTKDELLMEERKEYDKGNCINNRRPIASLEERRASEMEWMKDHREELNKRSKQYNIDNNEVYKEYQRKYRERKREESRV